MFWLITWWIKSWWKEKFGSILKLENFSTTCCIDGLKFGLEHKHNNATFTIRYIFWASFSRGRERRVSKRSFNNIFWVVKFYKDNNNNATNTHVNIIQILILNIILIPIVKIIIIIIILSNTINNTNNNTNININNNNNNNKNNIYIYI